MINFVLKKYYQFPDLVKGKRRLNINRVGISMSTFFATQIFFAHSTDKKNQTEKKIIIRKASTNILTKNLSGNLNKNIKMA